MINYKKFHRHRYLNKHRHQFHLVCYCKKDDHSGSISAVPIIKVRSELARSLNWNTILELNPSGKTI